MEVVDDQDRTPLHWAVLARSQDVVRLLLAAGANPNHVCPRDAEGFTPLHRCVGLGDAGLAMAQELLAAGADLSLADPRDRMTAADRAEQQSDSGLIAVLAAS